MSDAPGPRHDTRCDHIICRRYTVTPRLCCARVRYAIYFDAPSFYFGGQMRRVRRKVYYAYHAYTRHAADDMPPKHA